MSQVGAAFANAPFEEGGWDRALKLMAACTRSARGQIIGIGGKNSIPLNWITDSDPAEVGELAGVGGADPSRSWRVASAGGPLEVISEREYANARPRLDCDAYDELCDRLDMSFGCQTLLMAGGRAIFGLATLRTKADGLSTPEQLERFAQIAPHALAAIRLQLALVDEGARLLLGAFDAMRAAAFICDSTGTVCAFSKQAEELLSSGFLRLTGGRLQLPLWHLDKQFQRALCAVLSGAPAASPPALCLSGGDAPGAGRWCEILPLPAREWVFGFQPKAVVVVRSPAGLDSRHKWVFQTMLGLTPAEAEVARWMADGVAREEIAARRQASLGTVNSQIKSIFLKTQVTREAELVALLNRLLRL